MIRTGELIGRDSEGALNLDYFINPNRDIGTEIRIRIVGVHKGRAVMTRKTQAELPHCKGA